MSEQYRLVFSGEVLEGQHAAVVRKRLAALLKLNDERLDVLFSGKAVVVKKAADQTVAARYQQAFKKAGARLRVLPFEPTSATPGVAPVVANPVTPDPVGPSPMSDPTPVTDGTEASAIPALQAQVEDGRERRESHQSQEHEEGEDGITVLPPGSDLLEPEERADTPQADIDTSHIKVENVVFDMPVDDADAGHASEGPNVDHLTLAELGAQLGMGTTVEIVVAEIDVHFDVAALGALMMEPNEGEQMSEQSIAVDFEVAEPGATLGSTASPVTPSPPDVSHIELAPQAPAPDVAGAETNDVTSKQTETRPD